MNHNALAGVPLDITDMPMKVIELPLVNQTVKTKFKRKIVESNSRTYGEFCPMGDFHYGHASFSENMLHAYLNYTKRHTNLKLGLMGDIVECAALSRFVSEEVMDADRQIDEFCKDFRPIADRIEFMLWGNHEVREQVGSKNKILLPYMKLQAGAENAFVGDPQRGIYVVFKAGEVMYGAWFQHSRTQARVNRRLQLQRSGSQNLVSLIAHGHTHDLNHTTRTFFDIERLNGRVVNTIKRQHLVSTGCFLKYPSYAEDRSYPPTIIGAPLIRFYADHHEIRVYDLVTRHREYLNSDAAGASGPMFEHAKVNLADKWGNRDNKGVSERCLL